jgi:hypothetical protein
MIDTPFPVNENFAFAPLRVEANTLPPMYRLCRYVRHVPE